MGLHVTVAVFLCFLLTGIFKIQSPALCDSFLTKLLPLCQNYYNATKMMDCRTTLHTSVIINFNVDRVWQAWDVFFRAALMHRLADRNVRAPQKVTRGHDKCATLSLSLDKCMNFIATVDIIIPMLMFLAAS